MNKYQIIENKIQDYFIKKAKEYGGMIESYKLIISYDGILRYELYGNNNAFHGYKRIDEILNISFLEKAAVSMMKNPVTSQTVEKTLLETITKAANENDVIDKNIQLLLLPTQKYYTLKNRIKIKQINLTEIL